MIAIPAKDIGLLEYKIRPMLDKALDNTSDPQIDNTDHWIELLKCGAVYCFISKGFEFLCICSKTNRIFYINIVAGSNLKKYAQNCIEDISSFANFLGCKMIISQARLGAAKELKKNGFNEVKYVKKHVTMMKVIGDSTDY
jgi:hypothetical protein